MLLMVMLLGCRRANAAEVQVARRRLDLPLLVELRILASHLFLGASLARQPAGALFSDC